MVFSIQSFSNKVAYVAPRLRSSLQTFYGRPHELIDRYEISICGSFPQMQIFIFPVSPTKLSHDLTTSNTTSVASTGFMSVFYGVRVAPIFCLQFCVLCLCSVSCPFLMIPSIFSHIIVFYELSHFLKIVVQIIPFM